jgi:hypothetical protein
MIGVQLLKPFRIRLMEHPSSLAKGEKKAYGRFELTKKYAVLGIYGSDSYTDFLLADEDGIFHWVSSEICRKS